MESLTLDTQMLYELYGGSYEDVRFMLANYLEKHHEIVNAFNDAFDAGIGPLTRCSHRHSSSFTYIGMVQLTDECRNLERLCTRAVDTSEIKPAFDRLLGIIAQAPLLVKQELSRLERA